MGEPIDPGRSLADILREAGHEQLTKPRRRRATDPDPRDGSDPAAARRNPSDPPTGGAQVVYGRRKSDVRAADTGAGLRGDSSTGALAAEGSFVERRSSSRDTGSIADRRGPGTGSIADRRDGGPGTGSDRRDGNRGTGPVGERRGTGPVGERRGTGPVGERRGTGPVADRRGTGSIADRRGGGPDTGPGTDRRPPGGGAAAGPTTAAIPGLGGPSRKPGVPGATDSWPVIAAAPDDHPATGPLRGRGPSTGSRAVERRGEDARADLQDGSPDDIEDDAPVGLLSGALAWVRFAGEIVVAAALGVGLYYAFSVLWDLVPYAAVVAAPVAITGLVAGVGLWRARQGRPPIGLALLAVLLFAGTLLVIVPAAGLIAGR